MDREKVKGKKAHHFRSQDFLLNTVSYQFSSGSFKIAYLLNCQSFCEMAMFTLISLINMELGINVEGGVFGKN